jgi:hypothetical protein
MGKPLKKKFRLSKYLIITILLLFIAVIVLFMYKNSYKPANNYKENSTLSQSIGETSGTPMSNHVLFELTSPGSTNTPPWEINVFTDGSGSIVYQNPRLPGRISGTTKTFSQGTFNTPALQSELNQINFAHLPKCNGNSNWIGSASVSFGYVVTLHYYNYIIRTYCARDQTQMNLFEQVQKVYQMVDPV